MKEEKFEIEGKVIKSVRNGFIVQIENGREISCTLSGRLRKFGIFITEGDKIIAELGGYDLTKGRIIKRL